MRTAWWALASVLLIIVGQACATSAQGFPPPMYSAKEIQATVVAEDTRQPLEGVVVVAQWVLYRGGLGHGGHGPVLHIAEAVTNARGEFTIEGWGPKLRPPLTYLDDLSPELVFFKHGFLPTRLRNGGPDETPDRFDFTKFTTTQINRALLYGGNPDKMVQESFWNGQVLQLPPFRGTPEEWFRRLEFVADAVPYGSKMNADPNATIRLFTALLAEKAETLEVVKPVTTILDAIARMNQRRIGSVLVMEGDRLAGIFTERDVLTRVVTGRLDPAKTPVAEVMTRQPVTINPTTTVREAMMVVTDTRRRHLPVVAEGKVLGMVSIGDLTRWIVRNQQREIEDLTDYVMRA